MATTYITDLIARIRNQLLEATADKWSDAQITEYIAHAVGDVSMEMPRITYSDTYILGSTRLIDISTLSAIKFFRIQYEVGATGEREVPQEYKGFDQLGLTYLELKIDSTPQGSSLYTGTCTSTTSGKLVNSAATFTSTALYGWAANTTDSTATWVTAVDGTTTLSVQDNIFASGEAYIIYAAEPVRVWYETEHTYSETERTFNALVEELVMEGAVCYALMAFAIYAGDFATTGENVAPNFLAMSQARYQAYLARLQKLALQIKGIPQSRSYRRS